jgi:hypothetical protein
MVTSLISLPKSHPPRAINLCGVIAIKYRAHRQRSEFEAARQGRPEPKSLDPNGHIIFKNALTWKRNIGQRVSLVIPNRKRRRRIFWIEFELRRCE